MSSPPGSTISLAQQLLRAGRTAEALPLLREAARSQPRDVQVWFLLGAAHGQLGQPVEAEEALREAVALRPDLADLHYNLGNALKDQGQFGEAKASYRRALDLARAGGAPLAPRWVDCWNNLGNVWKSQGRLQEAEDCYREALALDPARPAIHSNLLFTLNYDRRYDRAAVFTEHRRWAAQHAAGLARTTEFPNSPDPDRRLRVAYLSPDFRRHAAAYFLEPLLASHDRSGFEVFGYASVARPDARTEQLRGLTDQWRDVAHLADEQVAGQVQADGIDILVECAGHTDGGRLLVLARRPAPLQGCYIGYPNTTGLDTVDFRITDAVCNPPDSEPFFTEKLLRLPCRYCYAPPPDLPEAGPLPLRERGYPTFASFNNLSKITPEVLELWARLLQAVPEARLVFKATSLTDPMTRAEIVARFSELGIGPERLDIRGASALGEYFAELRACDIALDPFPFNGGTTSYHALWTGLPVVTLAGESYMSRFGKSLLTTLDLGELVAHSPEEYVSIAAGLVQDPERLADLRAGLRARMAGSMLTDARAYTAAVEAAYRDLWRAWCQRQASGAKE